MIRNQRGDTLLVVMGVAAISLLVLAGISSQMVATQKSDQLMRNKSEVKILVGDMISALGAPALCQRAMNGGLNLPGFVPAKDAATGAYSTAGPKLEISLRVPTQAGEMMLQKDAVIDNLYKVESLTAQFKGPVNGALLDDAKVAGVVNGVSYTGANSLTRHTAQVSLVLARVNGMNGSEAMKPYKFDIGFYMDNGGIARTCTVDTGDAATCVRMGNVWNPAAVNEGERCLPNNHCYTMGSYAPPGSTNPFPNPLNNNAYSCPTGSTPVQTSVVSQANGCGKNCARNVSSVVFTCMVCSGAMRANLTGYNTPAPILEVDIDLSEQTNELEDQDVAGTEACYLLRADRKVKGEAIPADMDKSCPAIPATQICAPTDANCPLANRRLDISGNTTCITCLVANDPRNSTTTCKGRTSPQAPVDPTDPEEQLVDNRCCGKYVCAFK